LSLNEEVIVSKKSWQTPGSRMFLDVNSKVKVSDLIKGIIIQSGNDASVAIAEHIAGSEKSFASLFLISGSNPKN
jgi:D-alanyl-D-alanine carboxypeptidase (penicillin-binding protein 5/6)